MPLVSGFLFCEILPASHLEVEMEHFHEKGSLLLVIKKYLLTVHKYFLERYAKVDVQSHLGQYNTH